MSSVAEQESKFGEQVCLLRAAQGLIDDIAALSKKTKVLTNGDGLTFFDLVRVSLGMAENFNSSIYHELVPPITTLPDVQPLELVVLATFEIDPSFQDIFNRLVPLSVHLVASEYSGRKDVLVRQINGLLDQKVCIFSSTLIH